MNNQTPEPDEIWFMPGDLVEQWALAYRRGWERLTTEEQNDLLDATRAAVKDGRVGVIKNLSVPVASEIDSDSH